MAFGLFRNNNNNNRANNINSQPIFGQAGQFGHAPAHNQMRQTSSMHGMHNMSGNAGYSGGRQQVRRNVPPPQQGMQHWQASTAGHTPSQTMQAPRHSPQAQAPQRHMPHTNIPPTQAMQRQLPQQHPQMAQGLRSQTQPKSKGSSLPRLTQNTMENPFNSPLPDGVKLVPIDADTMKNLHSIGVTPPANSPTSTPKGHTPPKPSAPTQKPEQTSDAPAIAANAPPIAVNSLAPFIQNERNGAIFYANLAQKAHSPESQRYLAKISDNCNARREKLGVSYLQQQGEVFSPEQSDIELAATFTEGLQSAIAQEASAINELGRLYEANADPIFGKLLGSQLYSKIADIAILNMLLAK